MLATQLFAAYTPSIKSRKRARGGYFNNRKTLAVDLKDHEVGNRGKRASYTVCSAAVGGKKVKRTALGEVDGNALTRTELPKTRWGCLTCDVALCPTAKC